MCRSDPGPSTCSFGDGRRRAFRNNGMMPGRILLLGSRGWFGPALQAMGLQVVFATPGIVLATLCVTFPLVVRPLPR